MDKFKSREVATVFKNYPDAIRPRMMALRQLVLDTASESVDVVELEETLKWGEPSYVTSSGSTIRMDWKSAQPNQIALYFHCKTRLIDTFKELYGDRMLFEGNRAIVFAHSDDIPIEEVKHCIYLSLTYRRRKHLPMLGV